jgi:hypothetical protein
VKRADSLLKRFIQDLGIEHGVTLSRIRRDWNALFQKPLSYHISPAQLSDGELLITVDTSVWLQELKFFQEEIVGKLHPYGVKRVRFRLGRVAVTQKAGARYQKPEGRLIKPDEQVFIDETAAQIKDESLQDALKAAMRKSIASGRTKI